MRFTIALTILYSSMLMASTGAYSQDTKLTLQMKNVVVADVFKEIENISEFVFIFRDDMVDLNRKVSLNVENKNIRQILDKLFQASDNRYEIIDRQIIIVKKNFPEKGNPHVEEMVQEIPVSGTIIDNEGPLTGVNVIVKGTSIGTVTDVNGKFTINVPDENAILVFSFVGYTAVEQTVGNQRAINVVLNEDTREIEEVVVVGYGTQKKVNLTGAVAAVRVDETLSNRSVPNVSGGLQGLLPGLAVSQNNAMAGSNQVSLMIRGMGTVNNSNPLIVVDGIPDIDINRINMNDIESISVLKDAAASAVYGSRAANGVILITTRTGKGAKKTAVNLSASYSWGVPTNSLQYMPDYPRALELHRAREAVSLQESAFRYKKGTIDQWLALGMIDPLRYPNTDWWDVILRTATTQNYTLSATGSGDRSNFFASIGVMDENGLQFNNDYTRYTARFNYDFKIRNNMNTGIRFAGNWTKFQYFYATDGITDGANIPIISALAGITPYDPVTGYFGGPMAYNEVTGVSNPLLDYTNRLNNQNRQEVIPSMYIDWTPLKGLTARLDYSIFYYNQFLTRGETPVRQYNFQTNTPGFTVVADNAGIYQSSVTGYKTQSQAKLDYNTTIASNHNISVMASYSEEYWYQRDFNGSRLERIHPTLQELNAALTNVVSVGGSSSTEGLRSVIGRINYSAFDRYLLEINFRADGSSKFYPGHQWGYFPSAAVGWRFTEENFIRSLTEGWLTHGKIRASYGTLGNNFGVGRYEQKEVLGQSNYIINETVQKGFVNRKMINQSLSWEKTTVLNFGLDLGFFNNRLTAELDYYNKLTTDMIRPSDISIHLSGAYDAPRVNIGNMRNRGVEANITWREKKGEFNYMINFNAAYNRTVLEKWNVFLSRGMIYIDMPYRFVYSYSDRGIAQTWQDVYNATPQSAFPGDILRNDVNGSGTVDGNDLVAHTDFQRHRPTANFGLNASVSWKGIDLAVMLTGAAGRKDFWINSFNELNPLPQFAWGWDHWNNPWSWENRDGGWPRLGASTNRTETDFWLDSLAYLRLKNIQLGYSLPKRWINVLFIDNFRIYCTAENIATVTKFRGIDPERGGAGDSGGAANSLYPLVKSFAIGINVGF